MTRVAIAGFALLLAAVACRQEPKTPPNSPVPEIQRTDDEGSATPDPPPPLPGNDGG